MQNEEQAATAGDSSAYATASLTEDAAEHDESTEEVTEEVEQPTKPEEPKKEKIPQDEWQTRTEKAQKLDKLLEVLGESDEESEKDPADLITERLEALERENAAIKQESLKKDFEREVPATKGEKYAEAWEKACKDKLNPDSKYHKLEYSEIWKLLREDDARVQQTRKELEQSESNPYDGSVPVTGKSPAPETEGSLQKQTRDIMKQMGYRDEDFK